MREIVTGTPPSLFRAMAENVTRIRVHDPFVRVNILVPGKGIARAVRDQLPIALAELAASAGGGIQSQMGGPGTERHPPVGLFNVHVADVPSWAREFAAPEMERRGLTQLPRSASLAVTAEAIRRTKHLTRVFGTGQQKDDPRDRPSFHRAMLAEIIELKKGCVSAGDLRAANASRYSPEIAAVYEASEEILHKSNNVDLSGMMAISAESVEKNSVPAEGVWLFFGFLHANELEKRCLRALAKHAPDAAAYLPWVPGSVAFAVAEEVTRLFEETWQVERGRYTGATGIASDILGDLFRSDADEVHVNPSIDLASVADEETELVEAARWIWRVIESDGLRFSDFHIISPDPQRVYQLLTDAFKRAGVPIGSSPARALSETAAARSMLSLLRALESGLRRNEVIEFLSLVDPATGDENHAARETLASDWDMVTRKVGIIGGIGLNRTIRSEWHERLERHARALRHRIERESSEGADAGYGAAGLIAVEHATTLALAGIIEKLERARSSIESAGSWREWVTGLREARRDIGGAGDAEEEEKLALVLDELAGYDSLGQLPPPALRLAILENAFNETKTTQQTEPEGITFSDFDDAGIATCRAAIVIGLADGEFPRRRRRSALSVLDEPTVVHPDSGLSVELTKALDQSAFVMALSGAERLRLSYSRLPAGAGNERLPSSAFLEVIRRTTEPDDASGRALLWDGATLRRELVKRGGWAVREPIPKAKNCWLNEDEFLRERAGRMSGTDSGHLLAKWLGGFFADGLRLMEARKGDAATQYDGLIARTEVARHLSALGSRDIPFAARALETYADCPFRFFLMRVLNVEASPEPELVLDLAGMEFGLVLHEFLADFTQELIAAGLLKPPFGSQEEVRRAFEDFAERKRRDLEWRGSMPPRGVWQARWANLCESTWAAVVRLLRELGVWKPEYVELRLGVPAGEGVPSAPGTALISLPDGEPIAVRGIVDRVDFSHVDSRVRTIDYKSGLKPERPSGATDGGKMLQVFLYAQMVNEWLARQGSDRRVDEAAYLYLKSPTYDETLDAEPLLDTLEFCGERFQDGIEETDRVLSVIIPSMRAGCFLPLPEESPRSEHGSCAYCPVSEACGSHQSLARRWETCQRDISAARFLSLRRKGDPA